MKFAFMTFSCPELTLDEALALAKRYGYDGIEPRVASGHKHGVELDASAEARAEIRKKAEAAGVALCCVATSLRYSDPMEKAARVAETKSYIDLASDVGAPSIRVFGGPIPAGVSRAEAADSIVECLKAVADHALQKKVYVCVETHDDWCDPDHIADVLRRVNHPNIACNWDIMHPVRRASKSMTAAGTALMKYVRHVHFHDGVNAGLRCQLMPVGEGIVDHKAAVEILAFLKYDGYLSGEWINWKPYDEYLGPEIATMKGYVPADA